MAVLALCALMAALATTPAYGANRYRFIVRPKPGNDMSVVAARLGASILKQIPVDGAYVIEKEAASRDAAIAALAGDPTVFEAQDDGPIVVTPPDPPQLPFSFDAGPDPQGYTNQSALAQVNLGQARSISTGAGIRVAVLDTGVNILHPDLWGHCVLGYNAIRPIVPPLDLPDIGQGVDNSGVGHGTMLAGIIATIAPNATIVPVKVLNGDGTGRESDAVEGIYWAMAHGVKVINMSFGAPSSSPVFQRAIQRARSAGVVLVASAGNSGTDLAQCPAALPGVISVTSVEADNTKSVWASYGSTVSLVAPGSGIRSTYWTGGYATGSGTSFATPFVSGAAALVCSTCPASSSDAIANRLKTTATSVDSVNPAYAGLLGSGLLNIQQAVQNN